MLQVAALGAVTNTVVDFTTSNSIFIQCGGVKHLVELSKSMDSTVRLNTVWALRNLMFLADNSCKEVLFLELTASSLASLVCGNNCFHFCNDYITINFLICFPGNHIYMNIKHCPIPFKLQTLSLLYKSKLWLLSAILLMGASAL